MTTKRKLIYAIIGGVVILSLAGLSVYNIFFSSSAANQANQSQSDDGTPSYLLHTIAAQDPITLSGKSELQSDNGYFYNPELGEIETVHVQDGQTVKKGDVLFSYYQKKNKNDVEDAQREQTRLYNQREELLKQLREETGGMYNYKGDRIVQNWSNDGKSSYSVVEPIGKANTPSNTNNAAGQAQADQGQASGGEDSIKQQIRQVNQQIEDVEIKLLRAKEAQHSTVKANFSGRVVVNEKGLYDTKTPLVRVISEEAAVVGNVTEYEFYTLAKDRKAQLSVNADGRELEGTMVEHATVPNSTQSSGTGAADQAGGNNSSASSYSYKIAPSEFIQPGFTVKVKITMPGYLVPDQAIIEEAGKTFVFVYNSDGTVKKQEVQLERQGTNRVALNGLNVGDQLVLNPFGLKDGDQIKVAQDPTNMGEIDKNASPEAISPDQAQVIRH